MRILIVEDSTDVALLLRMALEEQLDARVERAADGEAALAALRSGAPFDVIVSDVMMPRLDGVLLVRQLLDEPAASGVPVIVVSGASTQVLDRLREREQVVAVFRKPVDPYRIVAAIQEQLG